MHSRPGPGEPPANVAPTGSGESTQFGMAHLTGHRSPPAPRSPAENVSAWCQGLSKSDAVEKGEEMPGLPPPVGSEAEGLVRYLRQQRNGLQNSAFGLSEQQLRLAPPRSALTVGGLIKHGVLMERQWVGMIAGRPPTADQAYVDSFALADTDTVSSLGSDLQQAAAETEAVIAGLPDLGVEVQLAEGPWYPRGEGYTARWILLHVLEELSRHAGHADLVREHIDGATMYELMAAVEDWPEDRWIKRWRPATS